MVCVSTKMMNELYKSGGQKVANKTRKTFKFNRRCQICIKKVKRHYYSSVDSYFKFLELDVYIHNSLASLWKHGSTKSWLTNM